MVSLALLLLSPAFARKNVLFLICDDLRPQMNQAYGQTFMHTPNFDRLANTSLTFDYAFTNMAICSASRNSFLSGRLPDNTRTWNFIDDFRMSGVSTGGRSGADWTTFPQHFKNNGYRVYGHGKLYHPSHPPQNDKPSWTGDRKYWPLSGNMGCPNAGAGERYCPGTDNNTAAYSDYEMVGHAIDTLVEVAADYKETGTNFWVGVGLHYPHQPWHTPEWTMGKYPPATDLAMAAHPYAPKNIPDVAFTAELDGKTGMMLNESLPGFAATRPEGVSGLTSYECATPGENTLPDYFQKQLRLGYYTAVTLADYNVGRVLDALNDLGIADDTIVILTGDHGWHLGEHAEWGKHSNLENAVQVPLLIRDPGSPSAGRHTQSFTELLDLYRTVSALAGVPEPEADVDGADVSALLAEPERMLKQEAYAQYSRCPGDRHWPSREPGHPAWYLNNCEGVPAENISFMGYSVRTADWRFTQWFPWNGARCEANFDEPLASELYSHEGQQPFPIDFDGWENENVAANHADVVDQHAALLIQKFRTGAALGCPRSPSPAPSEGPTPLRDRALVQWRASADGHWDSSLCASEECQSGKSEQFHYETVATEGYMPAEGTEGTVPLMQYWSSRDKDNFLTTGAQPEGYATPAKLNPAGIVFEKKPLWLSSDDTVPLQVWYNVELKDHLTLVLDSSARWAKANGYSLANAAIGYVYSSPKPNAALEESWPLSMLI